MSDWSSHVLSSSMDERYILESIIRLHNDGKPFDVDPCYSIGRFWQGLPQPKIKFDIRPQAKGVVAASADRLPLANRSVSSVMFDPPFITRTNLNGGGKIPTRFSFFPSVDKLWGFYQSSLNEFWRILDKGVVAFKCQDMLTGGRQWFSHYEIMKYAEQIGFYFQDLFVLSRRNVMFSPNMKNQKNARKNHCYFLVLRKGNGNSSRYSRVPLYENGRS